jgi:hypothetical protein
MTPFAVTGNDDTKVLMGGHDLKIFLEQGYLDPVPEKGSTVHFAGLKDTWFFFPQY